VLVLEDCGEMLLPDAKREVGQALGRLLNACDGLIGRGLRFLVLITTNEPADRLHPAVERPGRCAARIEFQQFSHADARMWMKAHTVHAIDSEFDRRLEGATLADLYGFVNGFAEGRDRRPVGFAA
jgi:ATP-dependent 26S proteasome regulatory subunit